MSELKIPHAAYLVVLMWALHVIQVLIPGDFMSLGIHPRSLAGLLGIVVAPWLHGGWWHLLGNSLPFLFLGAMIQLKSTETFWEVTLLIAVMAGVGTWLFGSSGSHVGASSLVLGYFSFIIADAWFRRSTGSFVIAFMALVAYGGLIFVLLDMRVHISWSGHVFGILAGVVVAKLYARSKDKEAAGDPAN